MFEKTSQLLNRQFADQQFSPLTDYQRILIVNGKGDGYLPYLAQAYPDKHFVSLHYNVADYLANQSTVRNNLQLICASHLDTQSGTSHFDAVIIYFPKSKAEFEYTLNNVLTLTQIGAPIWVVGDNKGGVKSCHNALTHFCTTINKVDAAKHCALFNATLHHVPTKFNLEDWYKHYTIKLNATNITVSSLPGVFSHGSVDDATQLLLNNLPTTHHGNILDFGCGAGVIGCYLAQQTSQNLVTCIDVNALAITSSKKTFENNQVTGNFLLTDGLNGVKQTFDHVVTNPPFHTGLKTDHQVTRNFITKIKSLMNNSANLTLVANNFLKYQPLLQQQFAHCNTVVKNTRFTVYHVTRTAF